MAAESIGRKLGIGLRLAAGAVQQRAAEAARSGSSSPSRPVPPASREVPSPRAVPAVSQAKSTARAAVRGAKRFGEAVWGPMVHTGGVLWLEITGLFFGLFALFFAQSVYRMRHDYAAGPDHVHFLVYAALTGIFTWFTISSFYRARQKEKKNRARRAAAQTPS
jgi:hypothetical protein